MIEIASHLANVLQQAAANELPIVAPAAAGSPVTWTPERVRALSETEVRQLRDNAHRLKRAAVVALCDDSLKSARAPQPPAALVPRRIKRRLLSRRDAFMRAGAALADPLASRSGVTKGGEVVFAMWAEDVQSAEGGSSHLLWSPNVKGAREWSDKPAGRERLEHCKRAAADGGTAYGMLVYGQRLEGVLPDDRAARVDGADPASLFALRVEARGPEYWAVWGARPL